MASHSHHGHGSRTVNCKNTQNSIHTEDVIHKTCKIYERKSISKYSPRLANPDFPWQYLQHLIQSESAEPPTDHCQHTLYSSSQAFIDHILWTLHPKSSIHENIENHRSHFMMQFMMQMGACTNCINTLLSTITFKDYINLYSVWHREPKIEFNEFMNKEPKFASDLSQNLFMHMCFHPQMPKIMIKTCSLTETDYRKKSKLSKQCRCQLKEFDIYNHDFDFICNLITLDLCSMSEVYGSCDVKDCNQTNCYQLRETGAGLKILRHVWYIKMFYLSIKYWNKYHILFFLRNYFCHFQQIITALGSVNTSVSHEVSVERQEIMDMFIDLMKIVLKEIIVRFNSEKLQFSDIQNQKVVKRIKKHKLDIMKTQRIHRIEIKESAKEMMTCSWIGCCKKQIDADIKFKVCSGCKMSYYCSKYCQKKSWNTQHRYNCETLFQYYNL
eukprot:203989_1